MAYVLLINRGWYLYSFYLKDTDSSINLQHIGKASKIPSETVYMFLDTFWSVFFSLQLSSPESYHFHRNEKEHFNYLLYTERTLGLPNPKSRMNEDLSFIQNANGCEGINCLPYEEVKNLPTGSGILRTVSNTSQLNAAISSAQPGDVIELDDGIYYNGIGKRIENLNGTAVAPITIQSKNHLGAKWYGNS